MPSYKTGRTRTLTYRGTFEGAIQAYYHETFGPGADAGNLPYFEFRTPLGKVTASVFGETYGGPSPAVYDVYHPALIVTAEDNLSGLPADVAAFEEFYYFGPGAPGPPGLSYTTPYFWTTTSLKGVWSMSVGVEEWVSWSEDAPTTSPHNLPPKLALTFYEVTAAGSNLVVTISLDEGPTATRTVGITGGNAFALDPRDDYVIYPKFFCNTVEKGLFQNVTKPPPGAGSASVTCYINDIELTSSYARSATGATISGLGVSTAAGPNVYPYEAFYQAQAEYSLNLPRPFTLGGVVRAWDAAYPTTLKAIVYRAGDEPAGHLVDVVSGAFSDSYSQRRWVYTGKLNGSDTSIDARDEFGAVSCKLQIASLASALDDTSADRCDGRGFWWDAMSVVQAATYDLTGSITHAGPGDYSAPWTPKKALHTYRFLRLRSYSAAGARTLTLGSKSWNLPATSPAADIEIDLCAPHNATMTADGTDSRWPLNDQNEDTENDTTDAFGWGVRTLAGFGITGGAFSTSGLRLFRQTDGHSLLTLVPTAEWRERYDWATAGGDPTYCRRFGDADTDGARSFEAEDWAYSQPASGPPAHFPTSIAGFVAYFNSVNADGYVWHPGWSATDLRGASGTALRWAGLNSGQYAAWLEGSGAFWNPDGDTWEYAFGLPVQATRTLRAQMLYDSVEWYGDAGDVWGWDSGAYGTALDMRVASILRGQAHGLVLDTGGGAEPGVSVVTDSGASGSGTSGARGEYESGPPYLTGAHSHAIEAQSGSPYPADVWAAKTRARRRWCFRVLQNVRLISPYNLTTARGHYHRTGLNPDRDVYYYRSNFCARPWDVSGVRVTSSGDCAVPCVEEDADGTLTLLYGRDTGAIYTRVSYDDGETWSGETVAIAGATRPCVRCDRMHTGLLIEAGLVKAAPSDTYGEIKLRVRWPGDTAWSGLVTAQVAGTDFEVNDDSFSLDFGAEDAARLFLEAVPRGGSDSKTYWTADYDTFGFVEAT